MYLGWYADLSPDQRPSHVQEAYDQLGGVEAWAQVAGAKVARFEAALAAERVATSGFPSTRRGSTAVGVVVDNQNVRFYLLAVDGHGDLPVSLRPLITADDIEAEAFGNRHASDRILLHMNRVLDNPKNDSRDFRLESVAGDFTSCTTGCLRRLKQYGVYGHQVDPRTPAPASEAESVPRLRAARGPLAMRIAAAGQTVQRRIARHALERSHAVMAVEDAGNLVEAVYAGEYGESPVREQAVMLVNRHHLHHEEWRTWMIDRADRNGEITFEDRDKFMAAYRVAHSAWAGYWALDDDPTTAALETVYHARKVLSPGEIESVAKDLLNRG